MRAGFPSDAAPVAALLAAVAIAAFGGRVPPGLRRVFHVPERSAPWFAIVCAVAALVLSALYVPFYLRGGPRIIDASAYYLEARTMAGGHLSLPALEPIQATLGRFMVLDPSGDRITVIFPPGFPAVLALGFMVGAPLAIGPLIAAALALVTFELARRFQVEGGGGDPSVPRIAAFLSVVCAALRYHTAETMSHGLSALCFAGAIAALLRAVEADCQRPMRFALLAGLASGWLFATRPVSALALGVTMIAALAASSGPRKQRFEIGCAIAAGALPGFLLFAAHAQEATGSLIGSAQQLYYATSDGPPGCFRYGFGHGVGCLGEHGDFVRDNLPNGFGAAAATMTTLRRLRLHLVDPLNAEPLFALVLAGAYFARTRWKALLLVVAVVAQIAAYVPFYFDGNYPGGGARFYADILPFEHALSAIAIVEIARRAPRLSAHRVAALSLAGFSFRASFDHVQLRDRDGGHPLFEPAVAKAAIAPGALLFVDTDHGFNLAFDPLSSRRNPVARFHGDALDREAWDDAGRPPAFRYRFDFATGAARVEPYDVDASASSVVEGESLWPPRRQDNGYAWIAFASESCVSSGRMLRVWSTGPGPAAVRLTLPKKLVAGRWVAPRAFLRDAHAVIDLVADGALVQSWPVAAGKSACVDVEGALVPPDAARVELVMSAVTKAESSIVALDQVRF